MNNTTSGSPAPYVIDVDEAIDASRSSPLLLAIVALCALVALLDGFDTLAITYAAPVIARAWQLPREAFGPIFAAHYAGAAAGAALFGLMADRVGRRPAILWATATFAVFALLTPLAGGFSSLFVLRALTGAGLGGALSNVIAMVSEFAPRRSRATMVSVMYAAFPLGGVLGGPLSTYLLASHGWEAVFIAGGIAPMLLLVMLCAALPESVRFLVARGADPKAIARTLQRLNPELNVAHAERFVLAEHAAKDAGTLRRIFGGEHLRTSVLLGAASFLNQLVIVYIITWLPTLLVAGGFGLGDAILVSSTFSLGGIVGSLVLARVVDRVQSWWPLTAAFLLAAAAIATVGLAPANRLMLFTVVGLAGGFIVGAQVNLSAYCATVYPTDVRSTGLGVIIGLGRGGAICGALMGTAFVAAGLSLQLQYVLSGFASLGIALLLHTARRTGAAPASPELGTKRSDVVATLAVQGTPASRSLGE